MQKIKYTSLRKGVYYIQIILPDGSLFRRSLLTDSPREALRLMDLLTPTIKQVKDSLLSVSHLIALTDQITSQTDSIKKDLLTPSIRGRATAFNPPVNLPIVKHSSIEEAVTYDYLSLSDVWEMYKKDRGSKWTLAIRQANERYFEIILEVLGANRDVHSIKKSDIRKVMEVVVTLPKRVVQPYRSMTVKQLMECRNLPEDDYIGTEAIHKHLKLYKSVFKTYLTDAKDILMKAPTDGVVAPQSSNRYGAYTEAEIKKFVAYALKLENPEWLKWIILLLAYTGARRGELATLTKQQIKRDEITNRHYILITDGKTENATREIALHPHLIEWGFLEFVARKHVLLFAEVAGKNMAKIGKVITDVRDELKIPYQDRQGQRRLVHSFRHSVVTAASEWMRDVTHVQAVVGHQLTGIGITRRYIHNLPIRVTAYIIDGLNWR
ncbi:tyrosine-type recombinase/integrase [Enterobacter mori]|uniref:tyrosine-type recombinase/integrase n=1 Tax=Enterobacter mori TaxID=539813 RepID=UPI00398B5552